jgi:hypothetical protein
MIRSLVFVLITILLFLPGKKVYCQEKQIDESVVLEKLFKRLVNNFNDDDRLRINDSILSIIDNYVESDSVFNHRFSNLKYLGQIKPLNSNLKIITWNLVLRNSPGKYYCYFIRKQENGKNKVTKLVAPYNDNPVHTDSTYNSSSWYGALYYDLKLYELSNNQHWVLLGIDYGNPDISKKIIEVISFTPKDSLIFGKKCFNTGTEIRYRDVFEYASNGMMSLRFRNDSTIVFDHLVPFSPAMENDRQYYGPDYSYDAYQLKKSGLWQLEINVDARNEE